MRIPAIGLQPWKRNSDGYIHFSDGYVGIGTDTPTEALHVSGWAIANDPVLPQHLATKAYVDTKINFTQEPITISINPSTGVDAGSDAYGFISNQAQSNDWGPFATMSGAARALPQNILYRVVFSLSDGTHTITDGSIFGDFSRLLFGWNNPNKIPSSSPTIPGR